MNRITDNLSRLQTPTTWQEELGFLEDSGYELSTIYGRALGSIQRAFKQGPRPDTTLGFSPDALPHFNPLNKLRITVELVGPNDKPIESTAVDVELTESKAGSK